MMTHHNNFVPPPIENRKRGLDLLEEHDSLASLAVAAHDQAEEKRRHAETVRASKQEELRARFMQHRLEDLAPSASAALAGQLGIPTDHRVIASIHWQLNPQEWADVTFTEEEDKIRASTNSGTTLWTTLDGMPLSVAIRRTDSGNDFSFSTRPTRGMTSGFTDLAGLGANIDTYKRNHGQQENEA
ncbi:hypothetical protein ABH924_003326 [Arthrobacter sp. GAS37]|uniref:hypothetical protein n=1 Tax=Arthrobacter sp. GAS37 TaxID=3156261 RepID=UPI003836673C